MLGSFRRASKSWLGKAVVAVLFTLLIASFAIWGIGDIFRGRTSDTIAKIGGTTISGQTLRNAFQQEVQRISRQSRQTLTLEQARAFGVDRRVLNRLLTEATLGAEAARLGLLVSDEKAASIIREDTAFQGANARFDRERFQEVLRSAGLGEKAYLQEQRDAMARFVLVEALTSGLEAPLSMQEAAYRYGAERRKAEYVLLTSAQVTATQNPSREELESFFKENSFRFRAPERRGFSFIRLTSDTLKNPQTVREDQIRKRYEEGGQTRFGTPERRSIEQIVFTDPQEAEQAAQRLVSGLSFENLAQERKIAPADLVIGPVTAQELFDPAIREAAFSLKEGAISPLLKGRFGSVMIRVVRIETGSLKPLPEVREILRGEIAESDARTALESLHDRIEDMRAAARSLGDIARETGLVIETVAPLDRQGRNHEGKERLSEGREMILEAVFRSDIGVDNEALRLTPTGYIWYDVTAIDPARERRFEEAESEIRKVWQQEEVARLLREKANALTDRANAGESLAGLAKGLGLERKQASDLARATPTSDLGETAIARLFLTAPGQAGHAALEDETRRVVFRVTESHTAPYLTTTQTALTVQEALKNSLLDDIISAYAAHLQSVAGVQLDMQAVQRALGGDSGR
jgi:peptidyl-prolyl cis-trans isomerase D